MQNRNLPAITADLTPAQAAAISYLARYTGKTHDLYVRYLGAWFQWCDGQGLDPLADVTRAHVELYIRHRRLDCGNKASTVGTALAPVKGYYKHACLDGLIERDPAAHALLPTVNTDPATKLGLDRLELGAFLATSKRISGKHYALAYLLGLLGLRVSEACGVQIENYADTERGHRVLRIVGKGNKPATIPLTIPVLRAMEAAQGDRAAGPLLTRVKDGAQLDKDGARSMVATIARHAGIEKRVHPHMLRASYITNMLDAGVTLRDVQIAARHSDPRTTEGYDRNRHDLDRHGNHILTAYVAGTV